MRRTLFILWLICACLIPFYASTARTAESDQLTIRPDILDIGTFYSGGRVTITGEIPQGQDVIIEIAGPISNAAFDVKGRVGPFWMTRGKAEVEGAPAMYVLLLPGSEEWREKAAGLGLSLEELGKKITIQSAMMSADELFKMFLKLKENEGLYGVQENAVAYAPAENGGRKFKADYRFPRSTPTGEYTFKATTVSNGMKGMERSHGFEVEEVGFTRLVYDLAMHQRLMYGILAVIIALFAGAAISLLFKGGGGSH